MFLLHLQILQYTGAIVIICFFSSSDVNSLANTHGISSFLAHRILISEILPWNRKSHLTHVSYPGCHMSATYIDCIGTHAHGRQVTSLLC